ncbi:unnamed protein product [Linum trigynum]|uniref:CCHC-type domain-containing protein n=1 Tax=Linum trigynum TaxID=586398 RepID=A0AAV2CTS0_9ROSI
MLFAALTKGEIPPAMLAERQRTRLMNFLMKLHSDFEPLCASLLHLNVTSMDDALAELLREETRLRSLNQLTHSTSGGESAFAVGRSGKPHFQKPVPAHVECHNCHEKGHVQIYCKKRNYCNYCKTFGHIVLECPTLAKRSKSGGSRPPSSPAYSAPAAAGPSAPPPPIVQAYGVQPAASLAPGVLGSVPGQLSMNSATLEQLVEATLQKVLPSALHSVFATHNHMSSLHDKFISLRSSPTLELQVANGSRIPVGAVGTWYCQTAESSSP